MAWKNRRVFRGGKDERKGELFSKRKMGKIIAMNFANIYGGTGDKEPDCQCRRHERSSYDLWVRKILGGEHGNPIQYSCLENPMDRAAWQVTVHRDTENQTGLNHGAPTPALVEKIGKCRLY